MEKERVIEIFLGGIFIILLIIMILSFTSASSTSSTTTTITISDSYNTYNIENTQPRYVQDFYPNKVSTKYYKTNKPNYDNDRNYLKYNYKTSKPYYYDDRDYLRYDYNKGRYQNENYLKYNSKSKYKYSEGIFGNEINEYKVYFQNKEPRSGYHTVKFYLADYEGKIRTESVTHYLKSYEGKVFTYKNVFNDEYDYAWNYKIISNNKVSNTQFYRY